MTDVMQSRERMLRGLMQEQRALEELYRLRAIEAAARAIFQHPHGSAEELDAMAALNALLQKDQVNGPR